MKPINERLDEALEMDKGQITELVTLIESMSDEDLCLIEEIIEEARSIYEVLSGIRRVLKAAKAQNPEIAQDQLYQKMVRLANEADPAKVGEEIGEDGLIKLLIAFSSSLKKLGMGELADQVEALTPKPGLGARLAKGAKEFIKPKAVKAEQPRWLRTMGNIAKIVGRR